MPHFGYSFFNRFIFGTGGPDELIGTSRSDIMFGFGGNDSFQSGIGNDIIHGGGGFDLSVYSGAVTDYTITSHGWWFPFVRVAGPAGEGTDRLYNVEGLFFAADDYVLFIDGGNNAVLARDDAAAIGENDTLVLSTQDLVGNDSEFDGDPLILTAVDAFSARGVAVTLVDGVVTYAPDAAFDPLTEGEVIEDSFAYTVDDGLGGSDTALVTVTVTGTNDAPVLTGGSAVSVAENTTDVATGLTATDVDSTALIWSLSGDDAALFSIDAATGALAFLTAPDFETPGDATGDGIYDVTVTVTDDLLASDSTDLNITVTDVNEVPDITGRINELHYDNAGTDTGEFIEVRVTAGDDISQAHVVLYNGSNGTEYASFGLSGAIVSSDGTYDYYVIALPGNGLQNGSPDGLALVNGPDVVEFLSYEGTFTATNGPAAGLTSIDIGVFEPGATPVGLSLQRNDDGTWRGPEDNTAGAANSGGGGGGGPTVLISQVQGSGDVSPLVGQTVTVSAVVTGVANGGFFLQEEDSDADADPLTSEGLFVFTSDGYAVSLGDLVSVTGTVVEFSGLTELTSISDVTITMSGVPLPAQTVILLSPDTPQNFEPLEGMRVSVDTGSPEPLTIIENFNLARFGEIAISAGVQVQPTQIFDAQTQSSEIAALRAENANARLLLEDGNRAQNPDEFQFLPIDPADDLNGNGYLDAGDNFGDDGATVRLGSVITAPINGILSQGFGDYRVVVTEQVQIDETTNSGARPATPDAVGGTLQVASVNALNYFTTFTGGSGPNGLNPRGADNAEELARQTDALVASIVGTGAEVIALQEVENGGFGDGSAIDTLVDALNADAAASGSSASYAFVDPTTDAGFVGTDAIMTAITYDTNAVTLIHAEVLVYEEASNATTQALADVLNPVVAPGDRVADLPRSRPSVAATFVDNATGETFTVVSSHFKSKGDSNLQDLADAAQAYLDAGGTDITQADIDALRADPNFDQGDGQGFWNAVRLDAAMELSEWIENDYMGGGVSDYLLLGDLNAYGQEDAVQYLRDDAGLTDLIETYIGFDAAYSFVFDGQRGSLDQGLASASLAVHVTGATEWHINADEPGLLNYDTTFTNPGFYNPGVYSASDHDPLIIGLDFTTDVPMI